jgi:Cu/Ag efflux pump CusA
MMRWLVGSSLKFGRVVVALAIAVPVLGISALRGASVDVYPEFAPPTVQIQTEALGLSAAEVEQLITLGLEQDLLNGVPWLDRIHSRSEPGLSVIDIVFEPGTDIYAARQMVQERLTQAHALPAVGSPPIMIEPLATTSRVAMVGLSSKNVPLIDMSVLARWKIRPKLMGIPGVANVSIYGQRDRQLQVQVDPEQLSSRGVTLSQVIETAGNALWVSPLTFVEASTPGTGGFIESPNQRLAIQHVLPITSPQELAAVPVEGAPAGTLRLGDVSQVVEDHQQLIGDALDKGAPSLFLVVQKFPEANTLQVTRAIEDAMTDLAPGLSGIAVDTSVYRPATFIQTALHNVGLAALLGLILLIALLLLAFASWRAALISLVAVTVSLLAAACVLYLRGVTFTTMTLVGLAVALALVVDDAVGDVELVRRRLRERRGTGESGSPVAAAVEACLESRSTLIFATLIGLLATLPFLVMSTLTTAFTKPMVLSYALAVLVSMLVALTLTPTLVVLLLRGTGTDSQDAVRPLARWISRAWDRGARAVVLRPGRAWIVAGVLAVAALTVVPQMGAQPLLPTMKDRNLLLQVTAVPGTSLTEMDRVTTAMSRELRGVAGVSNVGIHVGRAITSDTTADVNTGELWIELDDAADYQATQAAIRSVARGYAGILSNLLTYPSKRVTEVAAGTRDDLVVRVYGEDFSTLAAKAEEVRAAISHVEGVVAPRVVPLVQQPTVQVVVDLAAAQKYGLRPGDVRRDATTLTSQLIVGNLYEQAKVFDVVVKGSPATRASLSGLQDMLIETPSGGKVRLKDVASVKITPQPTAILHDEVSRSMEVIASVRGRSAADVTAEVKAKVAALSMPREFHAQVLGNAIVEQSGTRRVLAYGIAVLIAVYLLLQAATASWRRAAVLLALLPLACVGGVLAAPLAGGVRTAGALAGLFAVFALTTRGALTLARRIATLEQMRGSQPPSDTVLEATRERAVPVVLTALSTAAVLLPVVVFGGRAGLEILRPFAVTVLGGLVTSILVTLLVLPALLLATAPRPRAHQLDAEQAVAPVNV